MECSGNLAERRCFQPSDKLVSLGFDCSKDLINKQDSSEVIQCIMNRKVISYSDMLYSWAKKIVCFPSFGTSLKGEENA